MKFRITIVSAFVLASAMVVSAGQIEIGGVNGLTTAYVTAGGCSGTGPCAAGSVSSPFTDQNNYDEVLFKGLNNGSTTPVPYSTYSTTTANQGTITDTKANAVAADGPAGVTFAMINDGVNSSGCDSLCDESNNYWGITQGGTNPSITVPIGVFGVTDVWTMLSGSGDVAQSILTAIGANARDITLTFTFGTASNGGTTQTLKVGLGNTNDIGSTATGQVQNGVVCFVDPCFGVTTPASGPIATGSTAISGISVVADKVYNYPGGYNSNGNGSLILNDQGFIFNDIALGGGLTNLNSYLVSVKIAEVSPSGAYGTLDLSAITVDAIPEPSTVFMFLGGLGAIGFAKFRRRKA
jgi:hypothetical protein